MLRLTHRSRLRGHIVKEEDHVFELGVLSQTLSYSEININKESGEKEGKELIESPLKYSTVDGTHKAKAIKMHVFCRRTLFLF